MMPAQKKREIDHDPAYITGRDRGYQTRHGRAFAAKLTNAVARGIASDNPLVDAAALSAELERLAYDYSEFSEAEAEEVRARVRMAVPTDPEQCRSWCTHTHILVGVLHDKLAEYRSKRAVYAAQRTRIAELEEQIARERERHFRETRSPRTRWFGAPQAAHRCDLCGWFNKLPDPATIPSPDGYEAWIREAEHALTTLAAERARREAEREHRLQELAAQQAARLVEEREKHVARQLADVREFLSLPEFYPHRDAQDLRALGAELLAAGRLSLEEHIKLLDTIVQCEGELRREREWCDREDDFGSVADMPHESNKEFESRTLRLQYGRRGGSKESPGWDRKQCSLDHWAREKGTEPERRRPDGYDRDFRSLWRRQAVR